MYKIRERWIPAYMKHLFSAYMTSSRKAEISHAFFKKALSPNNSFLDFVTRFDRTLSRVRYNELDLDLKDLNEKPALKTSYFMESAMSELYTQTIFYEFQEELFQNMAYVVTITHEDEHRCLYNVKRVKESGSRVCEVLVEKSSNYVSCSCKKFECDGIPCRHMLVYFTRMMQIVDLPNQYILRRWTKLAKAVRVIDDLGGAVQEICYTSLLVRRNSLFQLASNVIDDAVLTEDGTELLREALESTQKKLPVMNLGSEDGEGSAIQVHIPLDHSFKEPLQVRAKGCRKRLKRGKEKAAKKGRRCNGCGLTGQSHDKRNCPKLLNFSSQDVRLNDDDDDNIDYD
ncbi:protein FAR1-RELATED SEQUENCE 5-like [Rhododendron vialii]|uniref:protein FAR1-RELATED SEQUENCE 5-like n=1 Tax=Rhododendron vialii TaxID=182163 RepID=UPI00265DCD02|nr:protein FAR1-RELATED SEQUENCE 5-like [Rhododendron vialii]